MVESKHRFLFEWILYNLFGGLCGICCGFLLFWSIITSPFLTSFDYFSDAPLLLAFFLFLFAFGLCLGVAQAIKLKEVEIQPSKWVMATACGCSVISLLYALDYMYWDHSYFLIIFILRGVVIGGLQLTALKKPSRIIGLWLLANITSLTVLEFIAWRVINAPIFITAIFFLPIPTGLVLWNHLAQVPSTKVININETAREYMKQKLLFPIIPVALLFVISSLVVMKNQHAKIYALCRNEVQDIVGYGPWIYQSTNFFPPPFFPQRVAVLFDDGTNIAECQVQWNSSEWQVLNVLETLVGCLDCQEGKFGVIP